MEKKLPENCEARQPTVDDRVAWAIDRAQKLADFFARAAATLSDSGLREREGMDLIDKIEATWCGLEEVSRDEMAVWQLIWVIEFAAQNPPMPEAAGEPLIERQTESELAFKAFRRWQPQHGARLGLSDFECAIAACRSASVPKNGVQPKWSLIAELARKMGVLGNQKGSSWARRWRQLKKRLPPDFLLRATADPLPPGK